LEEFVGPRPSNEDDNDDDDEEGDIVLLSMNRFERKKNIMLALEMMPTLKQTLPPKTYSRLKLHLAGGYDLKNVENVTHLQELKDRAQSLNLNLQQITFLPSVSDSVRSNLLTQARCVIYTPSREHFGIVPLEAMYAGAPVIAVSSGGPLETVIHGETGFLCSNSPEAFADAVAKLVSPGGKGKRLAVEMGRKGHEHVKVNFGAERFKENFGGLLREVRRRKMKGVERVLAGPVLWGLVAFIIGVVAIVFKQVIEW
jgi:alpha-1,3/alpha-1,6-mannosyltransferase